MGSTLFKGLLTPKYSKELDLRPTEELLLEDPLLLKQLISKLYENNEIKRAYVKFDLAVSDYYVISDRYKTKFNSQSDKAE
jgi:hypothetical protein